MRTGKPHGERVGAKGLDYFQLFSIDVVLVLILSGFYFRIRQSSSTPLLILSASLSNDRDNSDAPAREEAPKISPGNGPLGGKYKGGF